MIGAGTLINPLLRIATTVAILGAIYLFVARPVLDSTSDTINRALESAQPALHQLDGVQREAQRRAGRLLDCINHAHGDVDRIAACSRRFGS